MEKLTLTGHENKVKSLAKRADSLMGLVVVGILALFILRLPIFVIDMMIAMSIASGVMLLALAMYTPTALSLSTFPSLLLLSTIFRFAVSIASVKLILGEGHAGHIIEAFGNLVVGGSVVVGLVVFVVIAIVQFLVISKGSERVAEVSARFTLDGMPGKQMSIDADLRAGIIDREQARQRRLLLERESQMHGSMDGAMKFVKNDAIATLIVALVNMVAGIGIGMGNFDMSFSDALARYTLLTVGDAMVAQVPSLLTSLAAGVLITRVSTNDDSAKLGQQIGEQVLEQPAALVLGALVVGAFALVPGFPAVPFLIIASICGGIAIYMHRSKVHVGDLRSAQSMEMMREGDVRPQPMIANALPPIATPLQIRLNRVDEGKISPTLFNTQLGQVRERIRLDTGIPFPGLFLRFDDTVPVGKYAIDVQEIEIEQFTYDNGAEDVPIECRILEQLESVVRRRASAFLGIQDVQGMLNRAAAVMPELVSELQKACPLQRTTEVLRRLASERVSIRFQREIFDSIVGWSPRTNEMGMLVERVRVELGHLVVNPYLRNRVLNAFLLDVALEGRIRETLAVGANGPLLGLPPDETRAILAATTQALENRPKNRPIIVLTSAEIRRCVWTLYEPKIPNIVVLSFEELPSSIDVAVAGYLGIGTVDIRRVA